MEYYPVNQQLSVEILGEDLPRVWTRATQVTRPFSHFWVRSHEAIAPTTPVRFRFIIGSVPLLEGEGVVQTCQPVKRQRELSIEIEVQRTDPEDPAEITQRLAPFVIPEMRALYLSEIDEAQDSWLAPWIESSYRLMLLVDVIARINSTMDIESLLAAIMESAQVIMEAEASSLMMLDQETGELIITVPTGPARAEISGIRIPPGQGFGGWVVTHGKPVVVEDAQSDPRFFGDVSQDFQTRSLICVPLRSPQGEILGVLEAINRKDGGWFTEMDIPLFSALADQAAIAIEKARLHRESLEKQLLEQQLNLARQIQEGFWPKQLPSYPGVRFAGMSVPATQVGGDYYDFIPVDDQQCLVVVGDISGKGVPAALLMASLRAALRAQVENRHPIREIVSLVNSTIVKDTPPEKFVTLFCGILDAARREFTYVNGGHNPPLLYDPANDEIKRLEVGGPIVGILEDVPFASGCESLRPGQVLVIYTDGVTEAQNPEEELFGEERLEALVRQHASEDAQTLMETLYQAVVTFTEGAPQFDDITLVVMKMEAPAERTTHAS